MIQRYKCSLQELAEQLLLGSPGLMVMGGGSCSEGCGLESQYCIKDGHFSRIFVVKSAMFA